MNKKVKCIEGGRCIILGDEYTVIEELTIEVSDEAPYRYFEQTIYYRLAEEPDGWFDSSWFENVIPDEFILANLTDAFIIEQLIVELQNVQWGDSRRFEAREGLIILLSGKLNDEMKKQCNWFISGFLAGMKRGMP